MLALAAQNLDGSERLGLRTHPHVKILSKFEVLGPRNGRGATWQNASLVKKQNRARRAGAPGGRVHGERVRTAHKLINRITPPPRPPNYGRPDNQPLRRLWTGEAGEGFPLARSSNGVQ